jgi:hypothetical protein
MEDIETRDMKVTSKSSCQVTRAIAMVVIPVADGA